MSEAVPAPKSARTATTSYGAAAGPARRPALSDHMDPRPLLAATQAIATPALVVDVAAADANVAAAATGPVPLRPHFKAHKCTTLLRRQVEGDPRVQGVTCATASEAEVLAAAGFADVLVANEVADRPALQALARAAARTRMTTAVDDPRHVALLVEAGARVEVLIELDVGQGRCGLRPGSDAVLALARAVVAAPGLTLRGLQGYEGHAVLLADRAERTRHVDAADTALRREQQRMRAAGLPCELVSGGGTGTADLSRLDEVQAGSYVLMDTHYARLGLPFTPALACRANVVSRRDGRAVLDAGLKALSAEYGMPTALLPGAEVTSLADEHATITLPPDSQLAVGDAVLVLPAHVDPTVNLHSTLHAVHPDGTVEPWPVDGRRG